MMSGRIVMTHMCEPMNETIFAACMDICSHPSFSRRITSGSEDAAVAGSIGAPEIENPSI